MLAILLALASSLSYAAGDVLAGSQTRRTSLWTVIIFSQLAGLSLLALVVLARGRGLPEEVLLPSLAAGLLSVVAVATSFQALAIGVMSIIGPIFTLGAAVPVIAGLASGERPSALQLAGIGVALGGVVLASREKSAGDHHVATSKASILLALLTAASYGFVMVLYAHAGQSDPYWSLFVGRSTAITVFALAFVAMRPHLKLTRATAVPVLAVGVFETGGIALFTVASTLGYLSIVAVLSSVYPAFLALLAYVFVQERLSRTQQLGIASALVGVAMIAAG